MRLRGVTRINFIGDSLRPPDYVEDILLDVATTLSGKQARERGIAVIAWNLGHQAGQANALRALERQMAQMAGWR